MTTPNLNSTTYLRLRIRRFLQQVPPFVWVVAATLLLFTIVFIFYRTLVAPQSGVSDTTSLTVLSGNVSIQRGEPPTPATVSDGMSLQVRDTITTADKGYAVITFLDGTTLELEPNTTVMLSSLLQGRPNQPLATAITVRQTAGTTWSRIPTLVTSSQYQIESPAGIVMVRGTSVLVKVEPDSGRTQVQVYAGSAQVRGSDQEARLSPNTQTFVDKGKPPEDVTTLPPAPEKLRFTLSDPIWVRTVDTVNRSAGFVDPGIEVSQVPGTIASLPVGAPRFFEMPISQPGDYPVIIEGGFAGDYQLVVQGLSQDRSAYIEGVQGSVRPGQRFISTLSIQMQAGRITGGKLGPFMPLNTQGPGKYVRTQRAISGIAVTATAFAVLGAPTAITTATTSPTRTPTTVPTAIPTDTPGPTATITRTPLPTSVLPTTPTPVRSPTAPGGPTSTPTRIGGAAPP